MMSITHHEKKPVAERALVARLNRRLAKRAERLMRCSPRSRWFGDLGAYYVVSYEQGTVVARHCLLEELAFEHGVMAPHEVLVQGA